MRWTSSEDDPPSFSIVWWVLILGCLVIWALIGTGIRAAFFA